MHFLKLSHDALYIWGDEALQNPVQLEIVDFVQGLSTQASIIDIGDINRTHLFIYRLILNILN